ncbi:hypothetical protein KEF29_03260 [Streptomyces tuirus]|uniref:Uncharacterized protein n=1 Tax=Streptomyces tuirus TaxID=68278 RepID=A0A941J0I1_9ACTN|nr:hypothetical protein [Streptomyces tuirus]
MNHLPRPIADWLALWRDLPRFPRQVLLNRSHFPASTVALTGFMLADLVVDHPYTTITGYVAWVLLGPSSVAAFTGAVAHTLWERGWIWADLHCEVCDHGPDDGDDDPEPGAPDGGGDDLIGEITDYLRHHTASTLERPRHAAHVP